MKSIALLIAALTHNPSPDDYTRFGLPLLPAVVGEQCFYHTIETFVSPARLAFRRSRAWKEFLDGYCKTYAGYGRENEIADLRLDAHWRFRCWSEADDLADANLKAETRLRAARKLRELIGPVDFYAGRLPSPVPPLED